MLHEEASVPNDQLFVPYFTNHSEERSVVNQICIDVQLKIVFATLLKIFVLMMVMPVAVVLPAQSVHVTTNALAHPTKVPVLLREPVPVAVLPLTTIEAILFVSLAVHANVIDAQLTC